VLLCPLMRMDHLPTWAALIVSSAALAGCQPDSGGDPDTGTGANEQVARAPLPVAEPPIGRAELLRAVADVASESGLGRETAELQSRLEGKRFEVRIRFGCVMAAQSAISADAPFSVRFDTEQRTLRVRAEPDLTLDDPGVAAFGGEKVEAVEGFWMYRPWLLTDGCPAALPQPAGPSSPSAQAPSANAAAPPAGPVYSPRVGLANFFTSEDSRAGRRNDRAYEATKVLAENERPSAQGYNLVLSGRLRTLPGGRVISCRPRSASLPPECVVSATFDRVRIEKPGTNAVLAEWTS
jgi:hypothetical protein